jgi:hypothetical protein
MIKSLLEGFDAAGRLLLFCVKHEFGPPMRSYQGVGLKLSKSGKQFLSDPAPFSSAEDTSANSLGKEGIACHTVRAVP